MFLNGDIYNCSIENLALITLEENARLTNQNFRSNDIELTKAGLNVIRIEKKIKEMEEKGND